MGELARNAANDDAFVSALLELLGAAAGQVEIEKFLRAHFVYQSESFEIVRTPQFMLAELLERGWFAGDCDCVSTFAAALLVMFGHPAKFVAIRYSHPSEFEHVFVETDSYRIDPTVPRATVHKDLEKMTLEI